MTYQDFSPIRQVVCHGWLRSVRSGAWHDSFPMFFGARGIYTLATRTLSCENKTKSEIKICKQMSQATGQLTDPATLRLTTDVSRPCAPNIPNFQKRFIAWFVAVEAGIVISALAITVIDLKLPFMDVFAAMACLVRNSNYSKFVLYCWFLAACVPVIRKQITWAQNLFICFGTVDFEILMIVH